MKLGDAINTFAIRLYDWSLWDFIREMDEGCPLMSLVGLNNRSVTAFVSWVDQMPRAERETLAKALVRRAHENAAALRGNALTKEERDYWNSEFYQQVSTRKDELPPLTTADRRLPAFRSVDPDYCLDTLKATLSPLLGRPVRRKSGLYATRKIGDWKLTTEFTFRRRHEQLVCEYQFVRKDGFRIIGVGGPFPRNPFMFYGVWETSVNVPSQADSGPMAKAIAKVAEHFVTRADQLFIGLDITD